MSGSLDDKNLKFPVVTIMFDDGFSSVYTDAFPILQLYGYPASIAVNGSVINKSGYLKEGQLKELLNKGWSLSDHTYSHINCKHSSSKQIEKEIIENRRVANNIFGYKFRDFVFPKSRVSNASLKLVLSYYPVAFTGTTRIMSEVFPFRQRLLRRTEISTYETFLYRLKFSVFAKNLKQYLSDLSNKKRAEWMVIFTHNVLDKPGFFDTRKSMFKQILDDIYSTEIPVMTTAEVIDQTIKNSSGKTS